MSEPRRIGDILKDYILNSDDELAAGLRRLIAEHKSDLLDSMGSDKKEEKKDDK